MSVASTVVCVCEDDPLYQKTLQALVAPLLALRFSGDAAALWDSVAQSRPRAVLLDLCLPDAERGFAALKRLRAAFATLPIVVHSGLCGHPAVVRAMRLGATDYIPKGLPIAQLRQHLTQALCPALPPRPTAPLGATARLLGNSAAMCSLRAQVERLRAVRAHVVVQGESGTGKELVARALQQEGLPFVAVDCATIAESTADSMLFGHERGAFTGADRPRRGLLETAHGGTLFLDEIGNLSFDVQAKLLRALQEKEVVPLGSCKPRRADVRVVCASNRDLEALCAQGQFRADLYARLNVLCLTVPPLRARRDDVPLLLMHYLRRSFAEMYPGLPGDACPEPTAAAMAQLCAYEWPHNVRELCNTCVGLLVRCELGPIEVLHLPPKVATAARLADPVAAPRQWGDKLRAYEQAVLREEYALACGNVSQMARTLHMDRSHLHAKLRAYGLHRRKD